MRREKTYRKKSERGKKYINKRERDRNGKT